MGFCRLDLPESFYKEEERDGFLVSEKTKRIWAVELELLQVFDDICKRHGLRYFVDYGTMLGAVRHKGFIPWDDDLDVTMFRDDYERFKIIAEEEIKEPYCFQNAYNSVAVWGFAKIRDSRTSAIEYPNADSSFNQGIFIDIFPLDDALDDSGESAAVMKLATEIWVIINRPKEEAIKTIRSTPHRVMDDQMLDIFCNMERRDAFAQMEAYLNSNFGKSQNTNYIIDEILKLNPCKKRSCYGDILMMPFENVLVPVPVGYDEILRLNYGDYMEPVMGGSCHEGIVMDPDVPFTEYLKKKR